MALFFVLRFHMALFFVLRFYMALFSVLDQTHRALVARHFEWVTVAFTARFGIFTQVVYLHRYLVVTRLAGATWNCCRLKARSVYTIQPCTKLLCHFVWSHIRKVHMRLGVTCHLRFWQKEPDFFRATAVTRRWNGYRNKSTESWP